MALSSSEAATILETWDLLRPTQPNDTATSYAVAARLGVSYSTVYRHLQRRIEESEMPQTRSEKFVAAFGDVFTDSPKAAEALNGAPETSSDYETDGKPSYEPAGFVTGESVLLGPDGKTKLRWVKTQNNLTELWARETAKALAEELPKIVVEREDATPETERLVVIPMGDPHIGLYSWGEETGDDFDLSIAERDLCEAVDRVVKAAPPSTECLIANLGDFFHADNMDGETWRNKNRLDTDTRWAKVLRVGIKAMRYCIESAAKRHKKVTVINAIGNHDDHSSVFLSVCLAHLYENDERINVIDSPTIKHYYRYRNNLIGVHHGHNIKMSDLPIEMADDRPQDWAEAKHRYWLTGHIHRDTKIEVKGVTVESFRTLAARDAWAASRGYRSGRDLKAIVLHPEWGEIERHTVSVERLGWERRMANAA